MIFRPDLDGTPIGSSISINGQLMTHVGGGHFQPASVEPTILKRFDSNEGEPLHRLVA